MLLFESAYIRMRSFNGFTDRINSVADDQHQVFISYAHSAVSRLSLAFVGTRRLGSTTWNSHGILKACQRIHLQFKSGSRPLKKET